MQKVLDFIKYNTDLNPNDYVVVALSGGPDSMLLLYSLMEYRKTISINIVCAHVHHNLRKESDDEAKFVEEYCKKNNIIFEMTKFTYEDKFTESLGHKMRYQYFENIVNKYGAKYLFTAHHGDDLIETILMRMVRGSGFLGYSGFSSCVEKENYKILRPLISLTKSYILNFLDSNNIPYVIDNSNFDMKYTRNRYRRNILPVLKEEDENVHLKFIQFSNLLQEYDKYVQADVNKVYSKVAINNEINISMLKEYNVLIVKKVIYKWLYNYCGDLINDVTSKHIDSILSAINNNKPNIIMDIPNYKIVKKYNILSIELFNNTQDYEYIINDIAILPNGKKISKVDSSDINSNFVTYIDSKSIKLPLYVRNYRAGDKMTIKNMKGHKKLKDIFINEKIDFIERNGYPVVIDSNGEIIWLPGVKKSSFDNKKEGKYDIILEYH